MKYKLTLEYINSMGGVSRLVRFGTFAMVMREMHDIATLESEGLEFVKVTIRPLRPDEEEK